MATVRDKTTTVTDDSESKRARDTENLPKPRCILLFSGKRKSGKDYITNILQERLGDSECVTIKISGPIKSHWAKSLNLDLTELLGDGEYKEKYRMQMITWSEEMRRKDYGCFCSAAVDMYNAYGKSLWIVSDIRRKSDVKWFSEKFGNVCKTIRILADDSIRLQRGWIFTAGVDDAESECDLDDVTQWDLEIRNNDESVEDVLSKIFQLFR